MKSKRRRRYKKKQYDFFLISKIVLICYLAIFGIGYLSSDTSAYYSSQSEITQIITAGIWEEETKCGEGLKVDEKSGEEDKNSPLEGNEYDCENKNDLTKENDDKTECKQEENTAGETDPASNEEPKVACEKENEGKEEIAPEDGTIAEPIVEEKPESEKVIPVEEPNSKDDSQVQPIEKEKNPIDTDPVIDEASENSSDTQNNVETIDTEKEEKNIEEAEGETNEI